MTGEGFYNYGRGLDRTYAYATTGGANDRADFYDSAGDDRFYARAHKDDAYMTGEGFYHYGRGFDRTDAFATAGGEDDRAYLYDSPGNDIFSATSTYGTLRGDANEFYHYVENFDYVYAYATAGGDDDRAIFDSALSDELVSGRDSWARATRGDSEHLATGFGEVTAVAAPGETPTSDVADVDYIYRQIGDWQ